MKISIGIGVIAGLVMSVSGVGMRHDVDSGEYRQLASNEGKYMAGEKVPDFSPVCALVEGVGRDQEVTGSGTLVHPRFVLTAAHCVVEADRARRLLDDLSIRFGSDTKRGYVVGKVKKVHLPKSLKSKFYKPFGELNRYYTDAQENAAYRYDFALIELEEAIKGVMPAKVHYGDQVKVGEKLFIAGYGVVGPGNEKRERKLKNTRYRMAGENVLDRVFLSKKKGGMLVFDFDNGTRARNSLGEKLTRYKLRNFGRGKSDRKPLPLECSSYPGDSGGPAMMKVAGQWVVVGVCSYGTGYPVNSNRAKLQYGEINCYTYLAPHADWLKAVMGEKGKAE